jgi:hypothetical protein
MLIERRRGAGMPRRLRLGKRISPTVLGVVAAAVLVVGLVVAGRLLRVPTAGTPVQPATAIAAASLRQLIASTGHVRAPAFVMPVDPGIRAT